MIIFLLSVILFFVVLIFLRPKLKPRRKNDLNSLHREWRKRK